MRHLLNIMLSIFILTFAICAFSQSNQGDWNTPPPDQAGNKRNSQRKGSAAMYSMNFDKADASSVIKIFSKISKVPIVVDPDLKGNITISCAKKLSLQDMYEVINSALRVKGFAMVGGLDSKVIRVVSLKKAITDMTGVTVGKEIGASVADGDLITQVIPLDFADSDKVKDGLKSLISSDQASITSITTSNTVVITDYAANVRRLVNIIKDLDKDTLGAVEIGVYQCRFASADNLVTTLKTLFTTKTSSSSSSSTLSQRMPIMMGRPGEMGQSSSSTDSGTTSVRGDVNIASDSRTNMLIISGARQRINQVIEAAKELDVDVDPEVKAKFFPLKYADASAVADQLTELFEQSTSSSSSSSNRFSGFFSNMSSSSSSTQSTYAGLKRNKIVADVRTNSVIVTATEQNMKAFEAMIKELDAPKVFSEITRVYQLRYAQADDLAVSLNRLFQGYVVTTSSSSSSSSGSSTRSSGASSIERSTFGLGSSTTTSESESSPLEQLKNITVVAETKTNSLLVTGPPNTATLMDDLIAKLDRRTAQVFIEVAIVDVTLTNDTKFGVEWEWKGSSTNKNGTTYNHSGSTDFGLSSETNGFKYSVISNNMSALLYALKTRSNVKVLSTPTITTSDNVEASISIGEDVPYLSNETVTDNTTTKSVSFQNVAIALTVTPHVNDATNVIALEVNQTINEILGYQSALNNAPIVANREADTSISVKDGQTIVIGGIIKDSTSLDVSEVPVLSKLPLVGGLFRSKTNSKSKSELMVFLTPHIIKGEDDTTEITQQACEKLSIQPPKAIVEAGKK